MIYTIVYLHNGLTDRYYTLHLDNRLGLIDRTGEDEDGNYTTLIKVITL